MLGIGLSVALDPYLNLAFLAPIFIILLGLSFIASVFLVVSAWTKSDRWSAWGRVHTTLLALASLIFMGWLYYWNLLGLWQF
jgi:Trk-type K+ transport system membrane component